jgi:hypothetical protein
MPGTHPAGRPSGGEAPGHAPAARLISIQHAESPDDVAEAQLMADQRSAEQQTTTTDRVRACVPVPTAPQITSSSRAVRADLQTTTGVPAKPIAGPEPAVGTAAVGTAAVGETTAVVLRPPVVPGRAGAYAPRPVTKKTAVGRAAPVSFAAGPASITRPAIPGSIPPGRMAPGIPARRPGEPLIVEPGAATRPAPPRPAAPRRPAPTAVLAAVDPTAEARPDTATAPARRRSMPDLGLAPAVLALSSVGVLIVALAYSGGRTGSSTAMILYWIGQVVVFTPVVVRLLTRRLIGVSESFLLVMGLAINQYFLKWMYSPDQFRFPDELQHWLGTSILLETGKLFQPNPALPPAVHFPGLAEMGAAVSSLTGLPVTAAGLLVAAVAHLVFVAAIYAVVLRAGNSAAVAGVACVIYATALHYLFFNSMYLYATAALPFLMLAVWATRRWRSGDGWQFGLFAVVAIFGATVSHHVTAFVMVATLALLGASEWVFGGRPRRWSALLMPTVALAVVAGWIALVAQDVIDYLGAPVDQIAHTISVLMGDQPAVASAAPAPVPLVQLGIQGLGLVVMFVMYLAVARDTLQKRNRDAWRWALMTGAGIFFAGNGVRFLGQSGPEIAGRLSTFTYVPMSIVAAIALVHAVRVLPRRNADGQWLRGVPAPDAAPAVGARRFVRIVAGSAAITLLMVAARVGGWPPTWEMLPGPFVAAGFERSVDAYNLAATDWTRDTMGTHKRVGGDVTSVFLASTYGRQDPVRETAPLFYSPRWSQQDQDMVYGLGLDYLVVDQRLSTHLPAMTSYFEHDPDVATRQNPLARSQLTKFDTVPGADRLYDNGTIRIYRMGDR